MTIDPYLFVAVVLAVQLVAFGCGVALFVGVARRAENHVRTVADQAQSQVELNAKVAADQYERMSDQMRQASSFTAEHWRQHGLAMQALVKTHQQETDRAQAMGWYANWLLLRKCGIKPDEADALLAQGSWNGDIGGLPHRRERNRHRGVRTPAEEARIARERRAANDVNRVPVEAFDKDQDSGE